MHLYLYLSINPSGGDHLQYYKNIEGQNFELNLINGIVFIWEINYN